MRHEDEARVQVNDFVSPLVSEPARPSEPARDLNNEVFSAKLEAEVSESLSDLKIEVFSAKLETEVREPARDLKRELLSRSEERRVGKQCRSRWSPHHSKK